MFEFLETGQIIKSHLHCAYMRRSVFVSGAAKFPCRVCREATQHHYLGQPLTCVFPDLMVDPEYKCPEFYLNNKEAGTFL